MRTLIIFAFLFSNVSLFSQVDQSLDWFTFYGMSSDDEEFQFLGEMSGGDIVAAGYCYSAGLALGDVHQSFIGGESDVFVTRWSADGELIWSTYYGGEGFEFITGLAIDNNENIIVTGSTQSEELISFGDSYQDELLATTNAFVAKFNSGGQIIWSTYLGGDIAEAAEDIGLDSENNIYVNGISFSSNLSEINDFHGGGDGFIAKFNPEGVLDWYLYRGGSNIDRGRSLAVDSELNVYNLYATKQQEGLATIDAEQLSGQGQWSLILEKLTSEGELVWARYVSGNDKELIGVIDLVGPDIYLVGLTFSTEGIATPESFSEFKLVEEDEGSMFIAKFSNDGDKSWATYFGEKEFIFPTPGGYDIAANENGIYIASRVELEAPGYIFGDDPFQPSSNSSSGSMFGRDDALFMKWGLDGFPIFGTLFGGESGDVSRAILPINEGAQFVVSGGTSSELFYQDANSYQEENAGESDAFLALFTDQTLSVTNYLRPTEITIYPNPQVGETDLNIQLDYAVDKLVAWNIQGKKTKEWENLGFNPSIDISEFQAGVYILKIYTEQGLGIKRVVVE